MNKWDEMREAVEDAEYTLRAANSVSVDIAKLLAGRLRIVSQNYAGAAALCELKRELRDFNMNTYTWK